MKDMPDSDSDASDEGPFQGLNDAAMFVGEGPILYLQIMKTFAIMFLALSFINIPVFWIYTASHEVSIIDSIWQYDW